MPKGASCLSVHVWAMIADDFRCAQGNDGQINAGQLQGWKADNQSHKRCQDTCDGKGNQKSIPTFLDRGRACIGADCKKSGLAQTGLAAVAVDYVQGTGQCGVHHDGTDISQYQSLLNHKRKHDGYNKKSQQHGQLMFSKNAFALSIIPSPLSC